MMCDIYHGMAHDMVYSMVYGILCCVVYDIWNGVWYWYGVLCYCMVHIMVLSIV